VRKGKAARAADRSRRGRNSNSAHAARRRRPGLRRYRAGTN